MLVDFHHFFLFYTLKFLIHYFQFVNLTHLFSAFLFTLRRPWKTGVFSVSPLASMELLVLLYYQTLLCQIPPDILTNLGCFWRTFRWAKYKRMIQNIRPYISGRKVSDNIFIMHFLITIRQLWCQISLISNWKLVWPVWLLKLWDLYFTIILPIYS